MSEKYPFENFLLRKRKTLTLKAKCEAKWTSRAVVMECFYVPRVLLIKNME